jgi:hypothetical protein
MVEPARHAASFRDPSGFVFYYQGKYYRHIRPSYASDYAALMKELYQVLIDKELLIPHSEIKENLSGETDYFLTLLPRQIDFISYPYEWSFEQLKDTALVCLDIMKISIDHGLILKDASPFNFQLTGARPKLIDTLSFEIYNPLHPWIAYRQFCEGFLFPLMINHYLGIDAQQWLAIYPDGIPVSLINKILPFKSRFSLGAWLNVFLHQSVAKKSMQNRSEEVRFSKIKLHRLLDHLYSLTGSLKFQSSTGQDWSKYYEGASGDEYSGEKLRIFTEWLGELDFVSSLDIGTNLGIFAHALSTRCPMVIAADIDSRCINHLYLQIRNKPDKNIHPLLVDLATPPGNGGFSQVERKSFTERARVDLVSALAILHHLVLMRNIPLADFASYCNELSSKYLIIEFVPLLDPKVQLMLANKKIFHQPYDRDAFEKAFQPHFRIERKQPFPGNERMLYLMKKRSL